MAVKGPTWYIHDWMNEWLHNLPVWWMTLVVFATTYLAAGVIFAIVMALAKGERVRFQKCVHRPAGSLRDSFRPAGRI